ncbi:MAG: asparagine synthase (glutamine-hydrolyzing) [Parvicellaceae bacterium]|nr:MAG: Asparagine synthetase [glutamine-hydrolyzing] 1 [Crocinitomicaceae bacterium]
MCGIAGFIDFHKKSTKSNIQSMIEPLNHRGPDGEGVSLFKSKNAIIGFGHKRLSIIDLSQAGKQPMALNHLHITYNGEIYNYQEIKNELLELGHHFNGESDTEMILHAYTEWGIKAVERFIGMFAIALFDEKKQEVVFIRDRAGVKPLFYYQKNDLILFSSELKSFHEHPEFEKKLDLNAVAAYMQYGNVPTPHCIFKNCGKIKPGHYLKINLENKSQQEIQYWNVYDFYNQPKLNLSFPEAKIQTKELLKSAFNYRMVADVPVGVFLSGGYDSTTVSSLIQAESTARLKTFTIGVPDIGLNEAPYARDIAKHLGTDHTEINCTEEEAIEMIKDLPFFYDEPFADSSAIPTTLVSKAARKDVTVALSADGGDEIFGGYNRYDFMHRYGKTLNSIPKAVRKILVGAMGNISSEKIPVLKDKYNFHNRYEKLKTVLNDPSEKEIMLSLSQQFNDEQMKSVMKSEFTSLPTMFQSKEMLEDFKSPLSYMMAIDFQTYMLDDILQKVDRATMTNSLEGREPMLDHRILEFAAQLPDEYKYQNGIKKRILREITHDYIPKELLDRPKMGFAIPIAKWLKNELRDHVEEYLNEDRIEKQGIFNWEFITKLKMDFYKGRKEYDSKLWYFLMFQMWYERWMEN